MQTAPVVIIRLDSGKSRGPGDYRCTECGWEKLQVSRDRPRDHVRSHHPNRPVKTEHLTAKPLSARQARRKAVAEASKYLAGFIKEPTWPCTVSAMGRLNWARIYLEPGTGRRQPAGRYDGRAADGCQLSISLMANNALALGEWVNAAPALISNLLGTSYDVNVAISRAGLCIEQASGSAAVFVSLVLLMGGRLRQGKVVISGHVDLRGRVLEVAELKTKIGFCIQEGADLFIVPTASLEELNKEGWASEEEEAFVASSVRGVSNVAALLQLALTNFGPGAEGVAAAAARMDGAHVGCCGGAGLRNTDEVNPYEVQCCYREPGDMDLIMTGNLSDTSKVAIQGMVRLVESHLPILEHKFGRIFLPEPIGKTRMRPAPATPSLLRPGLSLHVHLSHFWTPIEAAYQTATVYLALASLALGRRPDDRTMVFGEVKDDGTFSAADWEILQVNIDDWVAYGFRRAILGAGVKLPDEVAAYARSLCEKDQQRLMDIIIVDSVLEASWLAFPVP